MTTTRTPEAIDAEVLACIKVALVATTDGNGYTGPRELAWAMRVPTATVRASLRRLQRACQVYVEPSGDRYVYRAA